MKKEDVLKFMEAKRLFEKEEAKTREHFRNIARDVADLKVWNEEEYCDDPENWNCAEIFEDGLGNTIDGFGVNEDLKTAWVFHTDKNCMQHEPWLQLTFNAEYLWNDDLFQTEIAAPLKVFSDIQEAKNQAAKAERQSREEERKRKEYEALKLQFEGEDGE
jgi:hypothetical protein